MGTEEEDDIVIAVGVSPMLHWTWLDTHVSRVVYAREGGRRGEYSRRARWCLGAPP